MQELELFDSEQQKTFKLMVSEDNYNEIVGNGNLALATELLTKEQEKENYLAACKTFQYNAGTFEKTNTTETSSVTVTTILQSKSDKSDSVRTPENIKIWTDEATALLIKLCKQYENEFESGIKKFVWNKIARQMSEKCKHLYTKEQCNTKWKGLKNMYKQIKKHNQQSGNYRKKWKYFEAMDEMLFSRPEINAPATCSSKAGLRVNSQPMPTTSVTPDQREHDSDKELSIDSSGNPTFHSSFMKKRKLVENATERRHKDKLARQDRYLDLLDRLTAAVEKSVENGQK